MDFYARPSRSPPSGKSKKLWNPTKVLGIFNTDPGYQCITCIGYAPSKRRRCRNPIRQSNRDLIMETLEEISYLDPHSPKVLSRLKTIVEPALCLAYHQNQSDSVLNNWKKELRHLEPAKIKQNPDSPVPKGRKQNLSKAQILKEAEEQLRMLNELLNSLRNASNDSEREDDNDDDDEDDDEDDDDDEDETEDEDDWEAVKEAAKRQQEEEFQRQRRRERLIALKKQQKEREEQERVEKERLEQERLKKERLEREKREKEEKERLEKERVERERKEKEEKERRAREQAAQNERIRQRAQEAREKRAREKLEREQKEREEWDQTWTKYQEQWKDFKTSTPEDGPIRKSVPWPVKSGSYSDVVASRVEEFFENAVPKDACMSKLMRKECLKWHPDSFQSWVRGFELSAADALIIEMICRVVTSLLTKSANRSSEFFQD